MAHAVGKCHTLEKRDGHVFFFSCLPIQSETNQSPPYSSLVASNGAQSRLTVLPISTARQVNRTLHRH